MDRIAQFIDELNEKLGRLVSWLAVVIVVVGSWNAMARYLGKSLGRNVHLNALQDLQWYLFSVMFLVGAAYTLKRDEHVRVDVLFSRFAPRTRLWINIVGTAAFLIPFSITVIWASWPLVRDAWVILETSPDPGGLARYPIKAAIPVGFFLLLLQGISELIKYIRALLQLGLPS